MAAPATSKKSLRFTDNITYEYNPDDDYTFRAEHLSIDDSSMAATGGMVHMNGHDSHENGLSWPADEEQYIDRRSAVQFTDDATRTRNNITQEQKNHYEAMSTAKVVAMTESTHSGGDQKPASPVRRAPTSLSGVNSNSRTRELMEWRVQSFNDNCHQDNFVSVSPRDHLTFHAVSSGENEKIDLIEFILLKNTGDKTIMYKIKTTSPEKFRVRPSCGFLPPRDRTIVRIFLQQSFADDATKEKFLVAAAQSDAEQVSNESFNMERFADLWKSVPKTNMFEYRLVCKLADEKETTIALRNCQNATTPRAVYDSQHNQVASTSSGLGRDVVESLTSEVRQLRMENRVLLAAMLTLLFILLFIIFHQRSVYQALSSRIDTGASVCKKALKFDRGD